MVGVIASVVELGGGDQGHCCRDEGGGEVGRGISEMGTCEIPK